MKSRKDEPESWRSLAAWAGVGLVVVSLPWWATLAIGVALLGIAAFRR